MTKLRDVITMMEDRKKSVGLYDSGGVIESDDTIRQMWVALDLDLDEVSDAIDEVIVSVMISIAGAMQNGFPAHAVIKSVWADSFAIGVMYERMRSGSL